MKKTLMFLALTLLASPAMAQYRSSNTDDAARGSLIDLSVVDRQSSYPLPVYRAQGLQFIEGTPGQAYSVRLTNKTPERLLVVLAVDGINAVSGKTAAYNQTGYVLEPYDQVEVSGWRQSMQSVAQFVFTTPSRSYAARTDRPWQVGVIGAAVFREDRARPVIAPAPSVSNRSSAPAAARSAQAESARGVGTGYGRSEWSQATASSFVRRSSTPAEVVRLDYDDREGLIARGIRLQGYYRPYDRRQPQAFPDGFAQPPSRRW